MSAATKMLNRATQLFKAADFDESSRRSDDSPLSQVTPSDVVETFFVTTKIITNAQFMRTKLMIHGINDQALLDCLNINSDFIGSYKQPDSGTEIESILNRTTGGLVVYLNSEFKILCHPIQSLMNVPSTEVCESPDLLHGYYAMCIAGTSGLRESLLGIAKSELAQSDSSKLAKHITNQ